MRAGRGTLGIYGAGGMGRDVVFILDAVDAALVDSGRVCFIDDAVRDHEPHSGLPCWSLAAFAAAHLHGQVVLAIGEPFARERTASRARDAGLEILSLHDPSVRIGRRVELGEGSVLCANTVLSTDLRFGRGVQINFGCAIGHDTVFGDFVTCAAGVVICGGARVDRNVWLGIGCKILPGVTIGAGAMIGAGAVVTRDVAPGTTVVGVPARPMDVALRRHAFAPETGT
jgi:sugar O-acyltransferase (sialic acid O-acetyltransferase NeuD family)